jgi:hypothetical protein
LQEPPESQEEDFDEAQDTLVAAAEQEAEDK